MKENESSVAVTEARHNLDSLLAGARLGRLTHIVKGSEILAHLVEQLSIPVDRGVSGDLRSGVLIAV